MEKAAFQPNATTQQNLLFGITFNSSALKTNIVDHLSNDKAAHDTDPFKITKNNKNRTLKGMRKQLEKLQSGFNAKIKRNNFKLSMYKVFISLLVCFSGF